MATILLQPDGIRIPDGLTNLARFRRWVHSPRFPEKGRIDWLAGEVEVDLTAENLDRHGTMKSAFAGDLRGVVETTDRGIVLVDSSRLSSPTADLSAEPDVLVVFFESIETGRVRLVPAAGDEQGYVEVEGAADLVVECVSRSSVEKDLTRLPRLYHRAGVREYWVADARGGAPVLTIFEHAPRRYRRVSPDRKGWLASKVLGLRVRLVALPPRAGLVRYRVEFEDA